MTLYPGHSPKFAGIKAQIGHSLLYMNSPTHIEGAIGNLLH